MVEVEQRVRAKSLACRPALAAVLALTGAITSVEAAQHSQAAEPFRISIRLKNNLKLQDHAWPVRDHVFVISENREQRIGDALSGCEPGFAADVNRFVIDPLAESDGHDLVSLEQIVSGVHPAGSWVILLRSGVHHLSRPLVVTAASGALTIAACPGETPWIDAPASGPAIVLKGSREVMLTGLMFSGPATSHVVVDGAANCVVEGNIFLNGNTAIILDRAQRNTIAGNLIRDVASTGIELKDGSDNNIVTNNLIDGADALETSGGGIFLHGTRGNRIAHNFIQRTAGFGIGISNWDEATINADTVIEYNLLRHTALNSDDSGAIYVLGRSGIDTGIVVVCNVIDGFGSPDRHNVGIYLDDSTSGATVLGNLIRGGGSDAVQIHGGRDNRIENNLFDLGIGRPSAVLFQAAPADTNPLNLQTGNVVSRNVILSANTNPRPFVWYEGGTPDIVGNFYVAPDGAVFSDAAPVADRAPSFGEAGLLPAASDPDYGPVQRAARQAIGFRPLDPAVAGLSKPRRGGTTR